MIDAAHSLWYQSPAETWNEALPLGNGRIGAMVFGGIQEERICLNEDTLWSGNPSFHPNPNAFPTWEKIRELIREERFYDAHHLVSTDFSQKPTERYLPLGDLLLTFENEAYSDYSRTLDLRQAVHTTTFRQDGVEFRREVCISHPDQVLAMKLSASEAGKLSFRIRFESQLCCAVGADSDSSILIRGSCPITIADKGTDQAYARYVYPEEDSQKGIQFACGIHALVRGGTLQANGTGLVVKEAEEAEIFFAIRTSFNGWDKHPVLEGKPYLVPCLRDLDNAVAKGYDAIAADAIRDHRLYYDRCELNLPGTGEEGLLTTDARLKRHQEGGEDLPLYALLFHYGRYLTIAASRPGTQATNLQGIWNHRIAAPWNSNYTININTEMNYWPTLMTGLPEFYEPMLKLISELAESGRRTAKEYFHARGFCSHHNTDLWRLSTPVGNGQVGCAMWSFWPMSSGWLMRHLCEYYEYTQDENWLRDTAYPLIRDCALFFTDVLEPDSDGYLAFIPSTSPENTFRDKDFRICATAETTTMTNAIIRDVFTMFLRFSRQLSAEDSLTEVVAEQLSRLRPFAIRPDGSLMEWNHDHTERDPHHRHLSHLYPMHPGRMITVEDTPELAAAVRKSLENRGDDGTGWSLGWKVNFWARLKDGDHAQKLIDMQLRMVNEKEINYGWGGGSYPNLLDAHPPFQIDGNFGVCAGIAEMLLQGDADRPQILPALPKAWKNGWVKGLRLPGNKTVDITWQDGKATDVVIR